MCFRFDAWCCFAPATEHECYDDGSSAKASAVPPHHHDGGPANATATTPRYPSTAERNGHYQYGLQGTAQHANGHHGAAQHANGHHRYGQLGAAHHANNGHYPYGHQGAALHANGHRAPHRQQHHPLAAAADEEDRKASNDARRSHSKPAAGAQEKAYGTLDRHPATNAKVVDGAPNNHYER